MQLRNDRIEDLHPFCRDRFLALQQKLIVNATGGKPLFLVFETYRSPAKQQQEYKEGDTKAQAWRSPHQWGFAADFVPYVNGNWTWDRPEGDWDYLRQCAIECGLTRPLLWDKPHIEHPDWHYVRSRLRA